VANGSDIVTDLRLEVRSQCDVFQRMVPKPL